MRTGATTTPSGSGAPEQGTVPRRIGRFRVVRSIARGGMGAVYAAYVEGPSGFEQWVAIKRVHPHLADDPKFVAMFLDEARIVARLQHPNVCPLIDFGAGPEGHWLA